MISKTRLGALVALTAIGLMAASATSASAFPSRTTPCSGCHDGAGATIVATQVSTVGTTATYNVSATGADAIAVFSGTTKLATILSSTGTFSVTTGATYDLFAVTGPGTSDGLGMASITPAVLPPVDATAPVTTSDAKATYVSSAAVKLTATDAGSGVAGTYYKVDGGAQVAGTSILVSALGSHTIEFWSVDVAGNIEGHKTASFTVTAPVPVDATAPVTTSDAKATYVSSAAVKLNTTDAGSGVAGTYYKVDGGAQVAGTSILVSALGSHTIEFWSVDVAGNTEGHKTASFTVTAPVPQEVGATATTITIGARRSRTSDDEDGRSRDEEERRSDAYVSLSGRLIPGADDLKVSLYVKNPGSTTWSLVKVLETSASDESTSARWRFRFSPTTRGTYAFQVRFDGTAIYAPSVSETVSVRVR